MASVALPTLAEKAAYDKVLRGGDPLMNPEALKMAADGHNHDHSDPRTKNLVSRSLATGVKDPTTPAQAAASREAVAKQRAEADPKIVPGDAPAARRDVPEDVYAMAQGCYAVQDAASGKWVSRAGSGYQAAASSMNDAEPFHFQATALGKYLLFDSAKDFVARTSGDPTGAIFSDSVGQAAKASPEADWTVSKGGDLFQFSLGDPDSALAVDDGGTVGLGVATGFSLHTIEGCQEWPEAETNVTGQPHKGISDMQEVRGYLDAHTHGMAYEFLGGRLHCGKPWDAYGVEVALSDCPDHTATGGNGALVDAAMGGGVSHDPVGWPTFKDWPAPNSLTHEGTYYKWMERAWRGGQRLFVNLLVENGQLCKVYPLKKNSCDDMDSIRLQAKRMHEFENYIDAQSGGPGEGWYRIVKDPYEARKVINDGKMAVVMGIETSVLFGCTAKADIPSCSKQQIDDQLDAVYDMGVRQMELVNKFDNALSGVAGDAGTTGAAINGANFLETGSFWKMEKCDDNGEGIEDREQVAAPSSGPQQDALFGSIKGVLDRLPTAVPVYGSGPHCNQRGLSELGDHTIRRMVDKKMLFDPDHMSVKGRVSSLDLLEDLNYPGVISSHSWSTPDAYPRIYRLGGVVTPYAGDSNGFVKKWKKHLDWADGRYYFGFGFGADINGLGAQGNPRGADVPDPVTYPFQGIGGVTIDKQVSGQRVYDINKDGVSHYGLYPDWMQDLRKIDGNTIVDDMERGPEAYLQMWERAEGVSNDACRDDRAVEQVSAITSIKDGSSVQTVLEQAGQPHSRLGSTFSYCAKTDVGKSSTVEVDFTANKVSAIKATVTADDEPSAEPSGSGEPAETPDPAAVADDDDAAGAASTAAGTSTAEAVPASDDETKSAADNGWMPGTGGPALGVILMALGMIAAGTTVVFRQRKRR